MKRVVNNFEKLKAWEAAHELVIIVYKASSNFPKNEAYRLTDQLCRSISSVAAILVEGNSRGSRKEYLHFAYLSRGSLEETKYHLLLARDLGYLDDTVYNDIMDKAEIVGKLINGLIKYLNSEKNV